MKNIILGILIISASVSFAQTDGAPTHQLKKRFAAKQTMVVKPVSTELRDNSENVDNVQSVSTAQNEVKSERTLGVVSIENGISYIYLKSDSSFERQVLATNLPKGMAIDGQGILFNYTVSDAPVRKGSVYAAEIEVFDVSLSHIK